MSVRACCAAAGILAAVAGGGPACSSATAAGDDSARSILFIGNSLTYVNDLPAPTEAAHAASESWPDDPPTPVPADTTTKSSAGGPC